MRKSKVSGMKHRENVFHVIYAGKCTLKDHINAQHAKEKGAKNILSSVPGNITTNHVLHSICVDCHYSVSFVHNTFHGPGFV